MRNYILKRFISALGVIFIISLITYGVLIVLPGNAALLMLGTDASPGAVLALEEAMGLDKPWIIRYAAWFLDFIRFDLGTSYVFGHSVKSLIFQRIPVTFSVAFLAMLMASAAAFALGTASAVKKGGLTDFASRFVMQAGSAMPSFWLGMMFIVYFGVEKRFFPISGYIPLSEGLSAHIKSIFLPAAVLAIGETGTLFRATRTAMLDALSKDYIIMTTVKGLPNLTVYFKYAFRTAVSVPLNVLGMQFAKLMGGTAVVESVFSLPGIGRLVLVAVEQRDIILLQGLVMSITTFVVLISLFIDISNMLINPMIREKVQGE